MPAVEEYTRTYSSYGGADIVAAFNGAVFGELQGITYSISREKAPIYTLGSPDPRSFTRGKRGIAGTLLFSVFDRDALINGFKDKIESGRLAIQKYKANEAIYNNKNYISIDEWDSQMSGLAGGSANPTEGTTGAQVSDLVGKYQPFYADEILPFDITVSFANEYGQRSVQTIYGVEILNEGSGFSMDTLVTEKSYTFVARKIDPMKALTDESDADISASF